jgi:hypothetical protein
VKKSKLPFESQILASVLHISGKFALNVAALPELKLIPASIPFSQIFPSFCPQTFIDEIITNKAAQKIFISKAKGKIEKQRLV